MLTYQWEVGAEGGIICEVMDHHSNLSGTITQGTENEPD